MTIPEQMTLTATIEARSEIPEGYEVTLPVPWSKYPNKMRVKPDAPHAADLKPGSAWAFTLRRGSLKKDRDGKAKDGSKEFDYYWDFVKADPPGSPPASALESPASDAAPRPQTRDYDARNTSIERQVALKAAVELTIAQFERVTEGATIEDAVLSLAGRFAAFIAGTPQEQLQTAPEALAMTILQFVNWCKAHGLTSETQVAEKLGMKATAWIAAEPRRTWEDAVKVLETKP